MSQGVGAKRFPEDKDKEVLAHYLDTVKQEGKEAVQGRVKMDPIPKGFGGRANQQKIDEAARFPWMKLVMDLWTGRIELRRRVLSAEEEEMLSKLNDKATVRENVMANGPQIHAANILMRLPCFPVDEGAIVSYCGLFFVLKSDGVHSRLIFDGRAGNLCLAGSGKFGRLPEPTQSVRASSMQHKSPFHVFELVKIPF